MRDNISITHTSEASEGSSLQPLDREEPNQIIISVVKCQLEIVLLFSPTVDALNEISFSFWSKTEPLKFGDLYFSSVKLETPNIARLVLYTQGQSSGATTIHKIKRMSRNQQMRGLSMIFYC